MKFEYSGLKEIENPTDEDIRNGIEHLGKTDDHFAILSKSEMTYIQVSGNEQDGYQVEYQIDDMDQHYRSTNGSISKDECIDCFTAFSNNDSSWKQIFTWEKEEISRSPGCLALLLIPFMITISLIILM